MSLLKSTISILLSTASLKAFPIMFGLFLLAFTEESFYQSFIYMIVFSTTLTVIISAGVAPYVIKQVSVTQSRGRKKVITSSFRAICALAMLGSVLSLLISFFYSGFENTYALFMLSIAVTLVSFCMPVLQALNFSKEVFLATAIAITLTSAMLVGCYYYDIEIFLFIYSGGYFVLAVMLVIILIKNGFINIKGLFSKCMGKENLLSIYLTLKGAGWIFLSNVTSMVAIFFFHSFLKSDVDANYTSFGFGYQMFSILVFIPNSLAPLLIRKFSRPDTAMKEKKRSFNSAMKISILLACTYSLLVILGYFIIETLGFGNATIIAMTMAAGIFAGALGPLFQYCIGVGREFNLFPASLSFSLALLALYFIFPQYYFYIFPFSYFISLTVLLILAARR